MSSCRYGKKWLVLLFLAVSIPIRANEAVPSEPATVNLGDAAPPFESIDEFGRPWSSSRHLQRRIVVLYFYPGDFTPGCTRQAQNFRESVNALMARGIQVVGISGDVSATHQLFKVAHRLNFTLLSDPEGAVARQFGVPVGPGGRVRAFDADRKPLWDDQGKTLVVTRPVTLGRWTLILDRNGKVVYKNTKADPARSAQEVLQAIEELERSDEH